jgi:NDP-hexose-3-ketoreductase
VKSIRIGVIGCAAIARRSMLPAMTALQDFELVAVSSRTRERAALFADEFGCEPMEGYANLVERDDIDAVYIPLPTGLHHEWAVASLRHGKHIIVEKSFADDLSHTQEIVDTARGRSLVCFENFMFLYHSQYQFVLKVLRDGAIGDIRCVRSSFGFPPLAEDNIRYRKALGGGALLDAGAYTVRAARLVLGDPLKLAASSLQCPSSVEVDIYGGAFLTGEKGRFAEIAFGFDNFYQNNIEVWGATGKLVVERAFSVPSTCQPKVILERQGERHEYVLPSDNHFVGSLKAFANIIAEGRPEREYDSILHQARLIQDIGTKGNATG